MHIGFIMDGNGRWAKAKGLDRIDGHTHGRDVADDIMKACVQRGIQYATFYAFSVQNWSRTHTEVNHIFELAKAQLKQMKGWILEHNVKVQCIGNRHHISESLRKEFEELEVLTQHCTGTVISICISYGGREEILEVFRGIKEPLSTLTTKSISDLFPVPDVDLVIRTSGEYRISNFLLWQSAYAEYYFTKTMWPDFTREELDKAISEFNTRNRRFGAEDVAEETEQTVESMYELVKELFSEYTENVDLKPIYEQLCADYAFTEFVQEEGEGERGAITKYSQASEGGTHLPLMIDDVLDTLSMKEQCIWLHRLSTDFSLETLDTLLGKNEKNSELFNKITKAERVLLKKVYECDHSMRTLADPVEKCIYRILSNYYYMKVYTKDMFSNNTLLYFASVISVTDDILDEDTDDSALHYLNSTTYRLLANMMNDLWRNSTTTTYKNPFVFLGTAMLLYRFENKEIIIPRTGGQVLQYIFTRGTKP
jgi:undecaprenyl diphosphate synthase